MDQTERAVLGLGAVRATIGLALLARPTLFARQLGVAAGTAERMTWGNTMIGAREIGLGAGMAMAVRAGASPTPWLLACVLADSADAAAFGNAVARGHVRKITGTLAALAALGGLLSHLQAYGRLRAAGAEA